MIGKIRAGILTTSITLAVMTYVSMPPAGASPPDAPREDIFGRTTQKTPPPRKGGTAPIRIRPSAPAPVPPHPPVSAASTPEQWFEAFDTFVAVYKPTPEDEVDMNQPFNQQVERVTNFCNIVAKIARNYKILAQQLESLPVPVQAPGAAEYRDRMVSWYKDSALVYEDMIRPRVPARTKEELNRTIDDLNQRSESLKKNGQTLAQMDSDLRLRYHVQPPKYDDALRAYAGHH
jgi:hypothetical protein